MRFLLFFTLNLILTSAAWAAPFTTENFTTKRVSLARTLKPARDVVRRGPFQTRTIKNDALKVTFQEGTLGPNWTEITANQKTLVNGKTRVSLAPSVLFNSQGQTGMGANIQVQLKNIVEVGHTSHFGAIDRHLTSVTLAPKAPVSLRALRVSGGNGTATRVGPAVKLGKSLNIWYGMGLGDTNDLVMATGNLRF